MEFLISLAITILLLYIIYASIKKKKYTKSNYFILIEHWKVEDGDFVTSGQELARARLCIESNTTERNIRFMPRVIRAHKSGYMKKILKGNRLYIKKIKNIDDISFDFEDIAIIE